MPYRICKSFTVENGHILSKHPGKCRFPHGHSRRIDVVLQADALDRNDMVCDFKRVGELIRDFIEQFDHAMCLNTDDPQYAFYQSTYERIVGFEKVDPTTELMARRVYEHLATELQRNEETAMTTRGLKALSVRIHETATSWAEYAV
jgi:6-pyruvoyltetrahydropterin/6-carboxytetrahydropterin synthase